MTHERGKSDRPIVPKKPTNKECGAPYYAERVEGRGLAKGNSVRQNRDRSLHRTILQSASD
jgi:RNA-directed DNA polymerase